LKINCLNLISHRKWEKLTNRHKLSLIKKFFLSLEQVLISNVALSIDQEVIIQTNFQLFQKENKQLEITKNSDNIYSIYQCLKLLFPEEMSLQKDHHYLPHLKLKDRHKQHPRLPIFIILDNLRSAFNVGSIIRTAECLNIEAIWFCGHSPLPEHPKVKNTAMGTEQYIHWLSFQTVDEAIMQAQQKGYQVYAIETEYHTSSIFDIIFPSPVALVFGNEVFGLSETTISLCHQCLNLPLAGWKNSLNVATAVAVVCFEIKRQILFSQL